MSASEFRGYLNAFWGGLTRVSWASLLTTVIVLLTLGASTLAIGEKLLIGRAASYIPLHGEDFYALATTEALRMEHSAGSRPALVLLGGSATNESLAEASEIERMLRGAGLDMEVFRLTTQRQNLIESFALLERLPDDRPAMIVLGLGPSRFTWTRAQLQKTIRFPRLGLRSEFLDVVSRELAMEPVPQTGLYVLDNFNFLIPRTLPALGRYFRGTSTPINRFPNNGRVIDKEEWVTRGEQIMKRWANYNRKFAFNADLLTLIIRRVNSNPRWEMVLIEHPLNPAFIDEFLGWERYGNFLERMETISTEERVPFWRLHVEAQLTSEDYFDWAHVNNDQARDRCTRVLLDHVKDVWMSGNES